MKSVKYGIQNPTSDFEKRSNEVNSPDGCTYVKGKKVVPSANVSGTQTKGFGATKK